MNAAVGSEREATSRVSRSVDLSRKLRPTFEPLLARYDELRIGEAERCGADYLRRLIL
jgi:hypothetical protein